VIRRLVVLLTVGVVAAGCATSVVPGSTAPASLKPIESVSPNPSMSPSMALVPLSDGNGRGIAQVTLPSDWMIVTYVDIATGESQAAWLGRHSAIHSDQLPPIVGMMHSEGFILFAADSVNTVDGFTPTLNATVSDVPLAAGGIEKWLAEQSARITKKYSLSTPLAYTPFKAAEADHLSGYTASLRLDLQGKALAGTQIVIPGLGAGNSALFSRALVLVFSCRVGQVEQYQKIVEGIIGSLTPAP